MKRVTFIADAFIPGDTPDVMRPVFTGTTVDLDDEVAGLCVVGGKAKYDKEAKLKSTADARMKAIDEAAANSAKTPAELAAEQMATMTQALAAMTQALAALQPAAPKA